jgi:hypothetical protein
MSKLAAGIIDRERNPFAIDSWINQNYKMTSERLAKAKKMDGWTVELIKKLDRNDNKYPAFLAVRWGYAEIIDEIFIIKESNDVKTVTEVNYIEKRKFKNNNVSKVIQMISKPENQDYISTIKHDLEEKRRILINIAENNHIQLDSIERKHILNYLQDELIPPKPETTSALMKEFVSSALSINQPPYRIRNKLTSLLGEIPLSNTIGKCLSILFDKEEFFHEHNWVPSRLLIILNTISTSQLDSFRIHIFTVLISLTKKMESELEHGLQLFYEKVEDHLDGPESSWDFVTRFTADINGVGPVLMSDFLKNSGFPQFVKIDQRLKAQFPKLINEIPSKQKEMFIFAWRLCEQLKITPFIFDHILYQWGNPTIQRYISRQSTL